MPEESEIVSNRMSELKMKLLKKKETVLPQPVPTPRPLTIPPTGDLMPTVKKPGLTYKSLVGIVNAQAPPTTNTAATTTGSRLRVAPANLAKQVSIDPGPVNNPPLPSLIRSNVVSLAPIKNEIKLIEEENRVNNPFGTPQPVQPMKKVIQLTKPRPSAPVTPKAVSQEVVQPSANPKDVEGFIKHHRIELKRKNVGVHIERLGARLNLGEFIFKHRQIINSYKVQKISS